LLPRTISTRIAFLAGFLTLGGAVTLSFILIQSQRRNILVEVVHGSDTVAEAIRLAIDHDMMANRSESIQQVIEAVAEHDGVERVRLFNKQGRIAYSSRPEEIGSEVDKRADGCIQCHSASEPFESLDQEQRSRIYDDSTAGRVVSTINVIRNEPGCAGEGCHESPTRMSVLGVLDVTVSLAAVQERLARSTRSAVLLSILAVFVISGSLFFLIGQVIRQPINRLIAATRRVAAGDWSPDSVSSAPDEIGFLARSFNEMVESVQTSQQDLEMKVAQKAEELRTAQFQVIQAEKLSSVGLVAAGIAHELNSPLMAIVTFAHLVQRKLPQESQESDDIRMILREADRCAAIIRTLLDFSRDQSQAPELEPCEAPAIIERALKILNVELRGRGIETTITVDGPVPSINANAVQLTQVLVNLLINAMHAMPEGGTITIHTDTSPRNAYSGLLLPLSPAGKLVRIRVRDTGTGIPRDNIGKVFDPFFTTKPVGQGSGLGLSVSHSILKRHSGALLVDSDGRSWTEFTMLIPVAMQTPEAASS
jgi:two-component system NtrC family sensor kinase